jgi:hypothetical protein
VRAQVGRENPAVIGPNRARHMTMSWQQNADPARSRSLKADLHFKRRMNGCG